MKIQTTKIQILIVICFEQYLKKLHIRNKFEVKKKNFTLRSN